MAEVTASGLSRVLFLCTRNSSRSQMAEGFLRARGGNRYEAFSAGTHPRPVHPLAIKAMTELGIDIGEQAGHRAKAHWGFPDPSKASGSEEEQLAVFRQVRDAIASCIETFVRRDEEESAE